MNATIRLVLWPSILTLAVSLLRVVLQLQGVISSRSGGSFALLGITWLTFVFGAWFGWVLAKSRSRPLPTRTVLWAVLPLGAIIAAVALGFGGIDVTDRSDAGYAVLRDTVGTIALIALGAAASCFAIWPRLAMTVLVYAIPARLTVVAITYVAKVQEWNTHYTKFGPAGIERDLSETMLAASVAQMGFWVPFTVVGGVLAGTIAARLRACCWSKNTPGAGAG